MMKFVAYSMTNDSSMFYLGTWYANDYADAQKIIVVESGVPLNNLKIYGRI